VLPIFYFIIHFNHKQQHQKPQKKTKTSKLVLNIENFITVESGPRLIYNIKADGTGSENDKITRECF